MQEIAEPHRPGWRYEIRTGTDYIVWAPRPGRPQWQASWQNADGTSGDFARGGSLDEVLAIFPPAMRGRFRTAAIGLAG